MSKGLIVTMASACWATTALGFLSAGYVLGVTHPLARQTADIVARQEAPPAPAALASRVVATPDMAVDQRAPQLPLPPAPVPAASVPVASASDPLANPKVGRAVMGELAKLDAVETDGTAGSATPPNDQVTTVFFDPRCHYCHGLFTSMVGKMAVRWVPVVALGDPQDGNSKALAILAAAGSGNEQITKTITLAFENAGLPPVVVDDAGLKKLKQNLEAFVAVHARDHKYGVPSVLIPHPDGTVTLHDGYSPGDEAVILASYRASR